MRAISISALIGILATFVRGDDSSEPAVAFLCGQPAMYFTWRASGHSWVKDDSTGCLKDPAEILKYCRMVFPTLDVRNVVEGSQKVTIKNWCDFRVTKCDKEFTVTPYRCLVGSFQSDALLVPEHCVFDHIHNSKVCTSFSEWNKTSAQSCESRSMMQQSFAMLQPCGIDKFSGVEFVCCPTKQVVEQSKDQNRPVSQTKPSIVYATPEVKPQRQQRGNARDSSYPQSEPQAGVSGGHRWNEHEYYLKVKHDLQRRHHDKMTKLMRDWGSARQRIQELKAKDPKAGEKLNKEITSRFQKMYEAQEVEETMERNQVALLHQQRVQTELNGKKEKAFDAYIETIDDTDSDVRRMLCIQCICF